MLYDMKRIFLILVFICYTTISFAQKPQLAIFVYNSNSATPTNALRSQLTNSFIEGNSDYDIVDRTDEILALLMAEYRYQGTGMVKDDNIISIGEHLAANYVCVVAITQYPDPDGYFIESKIIDVTKRQIIKNAIYPNGEQGEQTSVKNLNLHEQLDIAKKLSKKLISNIPSQIRKVGDVFALIDGVEYIVGYIDEDNHGIAFSESKVDDMCPDKNAPSSEQLGKIYSNKVSLGLYKEYWSSSHPHRGYITLSRRRGNLSKKEQKQRKMEEEAFRAKNEKEYVTIDFASGIYHDRVVDTISLFNLRIITF